MSNSSGTGPRGIYRQQFYDHIWQSSEDPRRKATAWGYKYKEGEPPPKYSKVQVYCRFCFDVHLQALRSQDSFSEVPMTDEVLREKCIFPFKSSYVFFLTVLQIIVWGAKRANNFDPNCIGFINSHSDTMKTHFRGCPYIPRDIKRQGGITVDESSHHHQSNNPPYVNSPTRRSRNSSSAQTRIRSATMPQEDNYAINEPPYPSIDVLHNLNLAAASTASQAAPSLAPSLGPSDSVSAVGRRGGSVVSSVSAPLSRAPSRTRSQLYPLPAKFEQERQRQFEDQFMRVVAAAGLSFSFADNIEWVRFCADFIPGAVPPSRKKVTHTILPRVVSGVREHARMAASGQEVTVQADGWTGLNNLHIIAFMINVRTKVRARYY